MAFFFFLITFLLKFLTSLYGTKFIGIDIVRRGSACASKSSLKPLAQTIVRFLLRYLVPRKFSHVFGTALSLPSMPSVVWTRGFLFKSRLGDRLRQP